MLTNLKGKLMNVTKNVGLLNNGSPDEKQSSVRSSVNLNAGAELLGHFQKQWVELHDLNEINAKSAEQLDELVTSVQCRSNRDRTNFGRISNLLLNTPSLKDSVDKCVSQISNLYETFETVEKELLVLEDLIEQLELEKTKMNHRELLNSYTEKKIANLETVRFSLGTKYVHSVTEHELKRKKELEERRQVFQEAFKNDIKLYKKLGTIPKIDLPKQQSALLEEIDIDFDQKELDQFFEDGN